VKITKKELENKKIVGYVALEENGGITFRISSIFSFRQHLILINQFSELLKEYAELHLQGLKEQNINSKLEALNSAIYLFDIIVRNISLVNEMIDDYSKAFGTKQETNISNTAIISGKKEENKNE
jgi:hypothetical protein